MRQKVLEATNVLRDALIARMDPVYGLQVMHESLQTFLAQPAPSSSHGERSHSGSHAFGLLGIGKFILRLPSVILEDELPRLKDALTVVRFWALGFQCESFR